MLESKPVEPNAPAAVDVAKAEPALEEPEVVKVSAGDIGTEVKLPNGKRKKVLQVLKGGASYYAEYFHGRLTANGERFDMNAMTAAHKTLPFGTWVRVRRTDTGKSVIVRINDRGPFIKGRIIDLSKEAGRRLGLMKIGVAKVEVDVLG
ncbi:MAG: septal ring lytic transglycosylase RlpA family protein [Gammaproteobacteria bacterium]|nr:septal ring lytic transglycosylase RlpA family protein [Gammaproteobacteria bacterium]